MSIVVSADDGEGAYAKARHGHQDNLLDWLVRSHGAVLQLIYKVHLRKEHPIGDTATVADGEPERPQRSCLATASADSRTVKPAAGSSSLSTRP